MGRIVPEGWFYAEIQDETSLETSYLFACSTECCTFEWRDGPGRLELASFDQQFLDVLTHTKDGTGEHTILVSDGDTVRLGSDVFEVRGRKLRRREEITEDSPEEAR